MLKGFTRDNNPNTEITITGVGDLDAAGEFFVNLTELEAVHHQTWQKAGVARGFNFDLTEHASNDDLAVLIVDLHLLRLVNLLDLVQQVLLNGFFPGNTQDVVGNQWAVDQGLSGSNFVTAVDQEVLPVRHEVLTLNSGFTTNNDCSLTTLTFSKNFNRSVDFSDDRWILWLTSFKNLGNTWQTTGNVRNTTRFTRHFGKNRTGTNLGTLFDHDHRTFWQVLHIECFAFRIFDHNLRMQVTLVIDDHHTNVSARFTLGSHRFAVNDVFETNLTGDFGKNWNRVWVPFAKNGALSDLFTFSNLERCTCWNCIRLNFTTPIINDRDLTVSIQDDLLTCCILNGSHSSQTSFTSLFRLDVRLNRLLTHTTTDVERTHGELSTRLTNTLSSDDTDSHPFFDQRTGGHVHSVTTATNTQRSVASHRGTNLNLLETHSFDLSCDLRSDHLTFVNNHFIGHRIDDGLPTNTSIDRVDKTDFDLFTTVNNTLGDPLGGTAVIHGDNNVLSNVGEFSSQVTTVSGLQRGISQTFTSTVGRTEVFQHRQSFTEIRFNRRLDDLTSRFRHQTTHTSELTNLLNTTTSTGV